MSRVQIIEVLLLIGVGLANLIEGVRLGMRPDLQLYDVLGPGRYLIVVGSALVIAGIFYLVNILRKKVEKEEIISISKGMRIKMLKVIGVLAIYTFMISALGYLISTAVFFILIHKVFEVEPWYKNIILSCFITIFLWLVFVYWLHMVFPRGILFD